MLICLYSVCVKKRSNYKLDSKPNATDHKTGHSGEYAKLYEKIGNQKK